MRCPWTTRSRDTSLTCPRKSGPEIPRGRQAGDTLRGEHGAYDGLLEDPRPPRPNDVGDRLHLTYGRGENYVPVHGRVHRINGAGQAVVGHLGDLRDLRLGEPCVRRHDTQGGVL